MSAVTSSFAWRGTRRPPRREGRVAGRRAPPRRRLQPLSAHLAEARHRPVEFRAGRSDSRPRARAGSHAAPPRHELPRGRPRAPLRAAWRRGGHLHQLRLRAAQRVRPHASPRRHHALAVGAPENGGGAAGVRARARHGAPAPGGRPFLARARHELLGRIVERHHASAGGDALPQPAARGRTRARRPPVRRARTWPCAR
jgi:hypothetical protein